MRGERERTRLPHPHLCATPEDEPREDRTKGPTATQPCVEAAGPHLQEEKESSGSGEEWLSAHLGDPWSFLPTVAGESLSHTASK